MKINEQRRPSEMNKSLTTLAIFMMKRQKFLFLILILFFITGAFFFVKVNNNNEIPYTQDIIKHKHLELNIRKATDVYLYKDSVPIKQTTKRPLLIGDYEEMLRNKPTGQCPCFNGTKTFHFYNSSDVLQSSSEYKTLQKVNITANRPTEECMKRRFPRAMVVGMTKGGTTALMTFLNFHPGVAARTEFPLDTRYFNYYIDTKDIEWYRHLLPCSYSNQITLEKSTEYFFTEHCAERIKQFNPSMKIIIAIKDPITRALSQYLMWKDQAGFRVGDKTFEQMITIGNGAQVDENSRLIIVSNYQKHMKAWLDNFSINQILFVDGHNFVSNPAEEINKVEDFLGIDRYFTQESFVYNATKGKYCLSLPGNDIDCLAAKKGMAHPKIDENLRQKLENYFKPLNERFFNMINRRFEWGY